MIDKINRSIVLVGLMGAGKSSIGRRLSVALGLAFVDADHEIEKAAGCSVEDYFDQYGEAAFRDGERKVMKRLLAGEPQIIATGGGAFMDEQTRAEIMRTGISVWLRADLDVILRRCMRRQNRPLLKQGDPKAILQELMNDRHPVYELADIVIDSGDGPHELVVDGVIAALQDFAAGAKSA